MTRKQIKQRLVITLINSVLYIVGFDSPAFASGRECHGFYSQNFHPFPGLKNKINDYRTRKLTKADVSNIAVNGTIYRVIGKLGGDRERVKVYLCEDLSGKLVQIKRTFGDTSLPNSIFYEMAVTRYYQEMGILVPRVIDYNVEKTRIGNSIYKTATIVKEYFEGLTGNELFFAPDEFTSAEADHMNQRLQTYRSEVGIAHRGFKSWLNKNNIDLYQNEFSRLDILIEHGDLDINNILYNADTDSGVVFDP